MNNQLQIPWVQPCEEFTPSTKTSLVATLQRKIQQVTCRVNKIDQFANSLSSSFASHDNYAQKVINRNILR